jgi:hypothetical protein
MGSGACRYRQPANVFRDLPSFSPAALAYTDTSRGIPLVIHVQVCNARAIAGLHAPS